MAVPRESQTGLLTCWGELPDLVGAVACPGGGAVLPFRGILSSWGFTGDHPAQLPSLLTGTTIQAR